MALWWQNPLLSRAIFLSSKDPEEIRNKFQVKSKILNLFFYYSDYKGPKRKEKKENDSTIFADWTPPQF